MVRCYAVAAVLLALVGVACGSTANQSSGGTAADLNLTLPGVEDIRRELSPPESTGHYVVKRSADTPQGPLDAKGVLAALGHGDVFRPAFEAAGLGTGAHVAYDVFLGATEPFQHIEVLAIKFGSNHDARRFQTQVQRLLTTVGHGVALDPPYGSVWTRPILQVPTTPLGYPIGNNFVTDRVYPDGTYYLFGVAVPGNRIASVPLQGLALRQDTEYQLCKSHPDSCGPAPMH